MNNILEMQDAAERMRQGLLAKATNGEYLDAEYKSDLEILKSSPEIAKLLPSMIRVNRSANDFRRAMQAVSPHYKQRREYILKQLEPLFEYLFTEETEHDAFTDGDLLNDDCVNIGHGGFGAVYKIHHKYLEMDFAIKVFEPLFVSNEENKEGEKRFFREAKILFSLNHENVVRVYDVGRFNGKPYIKMEYVDGENMQEYVTKNGPASFIRSIKPITALLYGLKYTHEKGVIHRDLKPTNFMVTKDSRFKIIDFGVSAFLETANHTQLTRTGENVVSCLYSDPQFMENPKLRDVRSDIYSVGAIWYYLIVGKAPSGADIRSVLLATGRVTQREANVILKCLSNEMENRYNNCEELLSAIKEIVTNE